jgi:hypothetical protein
MYPESDSTSGENQYLRSKGVCLIKKMEGVCHVTSFEQVKLIILT